MKKSGTVFLKPLYDSCDTEYDRMRDGDFFTSVGEGKTIALLLALKDSATPLIIKDLLPIVNHTQTLRARVDRMESEGLVDITVILEPHKRVEVSLTDTGREAALLFSMANLSVAPGKELKDKSLDLKHTDPILRMLRGKEYVVQKEFVDVLHSYDVVVKVLKRMEDDGLIVKSDNREGGREIRYSLTPLGKPISDSYSMVYNLIRKAESRHLP